MGPGFSASAGSCCWPGSRRIGRDWRGAEPWRPARKKSGDVRGRGSRNRLARALGHGEELIEILAVRLVVVLVVAVTEERWVRVECAAHQLVAVLRAIIVLPEVALTRSATVAPGKDDVV